MGRGLLLLVSGFLIIFGMIQNSLQHRQKELAERSPNYFYKEQSRNIASSLVDVTLSEFNKNKYWTPPETSYTLLNGKGIIRIDSSTAFGSRVYLTIRGVVGSGNAKTETTIKAVANRPAFSIYSYFTDREQFTSGQIIRFVTGDVLNGPIHTNGTFHIDGHPIFKGQVSSPHKWEDESYYRNSNPEFEKGTNFNHDIIKLPENLGDLSDDAKKGGLNFDNEKIKVLFNADGTADITSYLKTGTQKKCTRYYWWGSCAEYSTIPTYSSEGTTQNYNLSAPDFNGIISSNSLIEVKGIVKGNITLHSQKEIKIIGDVQYNDFDPDNPDAKLNSKNLLGLISEGDIIVGKDAQTDHGTQDLNITASVMAMGESFKVEDYNSGSARGKLRILGGLIQKARGAVGTTGSGGTGYIKHYTYDKRFLTNSTPDFPTVKRFEIDSWSETTKKVSDN